MKIISLSQKMNTVLVMLIMVITASAVQVHEIKLSIGGQTGHGTGGSDTGELESSSRTTSESYKGGTKI
jgi:hypothetical protein